MSRTLLTAELPTGAYPIVMSAMHFQAGDASNGNNVAFSGRRLVLYAHNTDGGNQTLLVSSVADAQGRLDNQTLTLTPDAMIRIDGIMAGGFSQVDGTLWLDVSSAAVELCLYYLDR